MKLRNFQQKLRKLGYSCLRKRGKGSDSVWRSSTQSKLIILCGKERPDIKHYQRLRFLKT